MTRREYDLAVERLIDQILPQAGRIVLDIGNLNDLSMENTRRLKEAKDAESS